MSKRGGILKEDTKEETKKRLSKGATNKMQRRKGKSKSKSKGKSDLSIALKVISKVRISKPLDARINKVGSSYVVDARDLDSSLLIYNKKSTKSRNKVVLDRLSRRGKEPELIIISDTELLSRVETAASTIDLRASFCADKFFMNKLERNLPDYIYFLKDDTSLDSNLDDSLEDFPYLIRGVNKGLKIEPGAKLESILGVTLDKEASYKLERSAERSKDIILKTIKRKK